MKKTVFLYAFVAALILVTCGKENPSQPSDTDAPAKGDYRAPFAQATPIVDGVADDTVWEAAEWAAIDELWLGSAPSAADFDGQYKIVWTAERLYLLVVLVDDKLVDKYRDPLEKWWEDDCLEIFLDEDRSGGDHTYNYNAFAYHVSYERHTVDLGTDQQPHLYDEHVKARWKRNGNDITWELAIAVYDDSFEYGGSNSPVKLSAGKVIGYMVAYCDADGSSGRESFIGSVPIAGPDKNLGWRDAGVFGELTLIK